jgi:hypothetical protein
MDFGLCNLQSNAMLAITWGERSGVVPLQFGNLLLESICERKNWPPLLKKRR